MFRQSRSLAIVALSVSALVVTTRPALADGTSASLRQSVASASVTAAPNFLVTGITTNTAEQQSSNGNTRHEGVGIGVKGGFLFNNFKQAQASIDNKAGWLAGIFFGGNRPGVVGVQGEILYAKKSYAITGQTTDLYFLEIPILMRINAGSSSLNGLSFYGIVGPAFDINLKSKLNGVDVKDSYESLDIGLIFGGGVEITRFLIEARYNNGLKNVLKSTGGSTTDLKTRSFALMAGFRFN